MKKLEVIDCKYMGYGLHESECIVHCYEDQNGFVLICKDINKGTSVVNAIEIIMDQLKSKYPIKQTTYYELTPYYEDDIPSLVKFVYDEFENRISITNFLPIQDKTINNEIEKIRQDFIERQKKIKRTKEGHDEANDHVRENG